MRRIKYSVALRKEAVDKLHARAGRTAGLQPRYSDIGGSLFKRRKLSDYFEGAVRMGSRSDGIAKGLHVPIWGTLVLSKNLHFNPGARVRASDLREYAYCPEAARFHMRGETVNHGARQRMARGEAAHARWNRREVERHAQPSTFGRLVRIGVVLLLIAVVVWLWLSWGGTVR